MTAAASSSSTRSKRSPSGAVPRPSSVRLTFVRPSLRVFRGGRLAPLMLQVLPSPKKRNRTPAIPRARSRRELFLRLRSEAQRIALRRAGLGAAGGLGLGDVLREHGHDADAFAMRGHHHVERLGFVEPEHRLQHLHHEVAGRVVIIEQNDFMQTWTLDAGFGLDLPLGGDLAHPVISFKAACRRGDKYSGTRNPPVSSRFTPPRRSHRPLFRRSARGAARFLRRNRDARHRSPPRPPMLNTRQPVLRNFWYAALPAAELDEGPKPLRILGQDIVLFLDAVGEPAAHEDRCCHRTAKLSKGWINNGHIVCGYHGWEYDRSGKL